MPSPTTKKSFAEREEAAEAKAEPAPTITSAVPYTAEEEACLREHLTASLLEQQERQSRDGDAAWTKTTLPLLVSMVAKVLQLAADNYNEESGTAGGAPATPATDTTTTKNQLPRGSGPTSLPAKPPSKMECFLEENTYLLEQLRLQQWAFFTLPRLWEILADPFMYNSDATGKLRSAKLQAAVRRCVLSSAPLFTAPSSLISMNEVSTG
ncbi:hypothetical protein TraAM80_00736 [Trypanosoma rangeli]|uniref:Uncharacterized protein n=1 Tax=Trypanosoma rangeli TaxID=5698 RepID=A0A422P1Z0_TRYRA|nr:uncharacterized protein TraAM80_00736 [Trypanosoma rangeli]RNF11753.1 hypothetical protein TraAM80_00736 [Trypanosoma rangeli]|eukprot:RNF11753.1 hypothetical protein TraAM80_00736 [Trypanosoma rangeli]